MLLYFISILFLTVINFSRLSLYLNVVCYVDMHTYNFTFTWFNIFAIHIHIHWTKIDSSPILYRCFTEHKITHIFFQVIYFKYAYIPYPANGYKHPLKKIFILCEKLEMKCGGNKIVKCDENDVFCKNVCSSFYETCVELTLSCIFSLWFLYLF